MCAPILPVLASPGLAATAGPLAVAAGTPALLGSTILGGIGQIAQGRAARRAAELGVRIAERNAALARQHAEAEARRRRRKGEALVGRRRAGFAAAGVVLEGTPVDLLADTAAEAELDALDILREGELRARGLRIGAAGRRLRDHARSRAAFVGAGQSLLGGIGRLARRFPV